MSEFNNNNYENREPIYHYNEQQADNFSTAHQPSGSRKKQHKAGRAIKKIGAFTLSAVLFGGVASGTFLGITNAAGYSPETLSALRTSQETAAESTVAASSGNTSVLQTTAVSPESAVIKGSLDVSEIATAVMPSIVSITNKSVQEIQNYFSMFGYGGQTQSVETESCGSGIIIGKNDTELLIVTNNHVVENADTLSACFIDNQAYEANIKGTDPDNDLAVIAIPLADISEDTMSQIKVAAIGDSDSLQVGQQVVAIGNALGYGQSVTTGIVSATDRTIGTQVVNTSTEDTAETATYIQTDAAINPGNSGGALVNMNGEVVGINSAKLASTEVEGMGYAIPVSRVSDIIETLMNETTRTKVAENLKSSIGISGLTVDSSVNQAYGIPSGVYIAEVTEGSAAQKAGLAKGQVITAFDGKAIEGIEELKDRLQYYAAGETVEMTVKVPGSGEYTEKTVTITLDHAAGTAAADSSESADTTEPTPWTDSFKH
ncbi:MAG: trypsin-like peptidase domain-containing protein [Lachnospiraceae bacterium]|nr:trypsin-like peptidase domain-containing protein [Lachnospiraceae bacterium]